MRQIFHHFFPVRQLSSRMFQQHAVKEANRTDRHIAGYENEIILFSDPSTNTLTCSSAQVNREIRNTLYQRPFSGN